MDWILLALSWAGYALALLRLRVLPLEAEEGRARLPGGWMAVLQALCGLFLTIFTAVTALFLRHGQDAGIFPWMALLAALDAGFAAYPCIRWNADGLSVRNMLGWTRVIPWAQVRGWYQYGSSLWLKTARGRVLLPGIMGGGERLLSGARTRVASPDNTPLPLIPDVFCGHVKRPGQLLGALIVQLVVGMLMAGQGAYLLGTANASPDNTQQETAVFGSFRQTRQEHFMLCAEEADYFVPSIADATLMMQRCGTGETFTLWTRPYLDARAVCRAVGGDGTVYLDFADFNADQAGEAAFELVAGLLALTGAALTVWGCRWPERSGAWLRRMTARLREQ